MLAVLLGAAFLVMVLWETFETIVLPRGVTRKLRLTRLYYVLVWKVYGARARSADRAARLEQYLSLFGPLSLLVLIALWAMGLILSFAVIQWGIGSRILSDHAAAGFSTDLYMSGATFFTLGYGDVTPGPGLPRIIAVTESGVGFGFLAVVIGYLPVMYQAFSRREVGISLLDARAGSPPSAGELLRRHAAGGQMAALTDLLKVFETWTSDVMESHISYPVLAFYRSQHDRVSWLYSLTAVLDCCALVSTGFEGKPEWAGPLLWQAHHTFAMARHCVVDLAVTLNAHPIVSEEERLTPEKLRLVRENAAEWGVVLRAPAAPDDALRELRGEYEPYVRGLAFRMALTLPDWTHAENVADNWQTTAWGQESHL